MLIAYYIYTIYERNINETNNLAWLTQLLFDCLCCFAGIDSDVLANKDATPSAEADEEGDLFDIYAVGEEEDDDEVCVHINSR